MSEEEGVETGRGFWRERRGGGDVEKGEGGLRGGWKDGLGWG